MFVLSGISDWIGRFWDSWAYEDLKLRLSTILSATLPKENERELAFHSLKEFV